MSGPRRRLLTLALLAMSVSACADATTGGGPPASAPSSQVTSEPPPPPTALPAATDQMVVISHATTTPLELTSAEVARLGSGRIQHWRGKRVIVGRPAAAAVAAVEQDRDALAVVPVSAVRPTVVTANVDGRDPVRDHRDARQLVVVGDVMLTRGVPDPAAALAPMSTILRSADVTVGNLESTLSTRGRPTQGGDSFGGGRRLLAPLRRAGFDALSLANNHSGDFGTRALLDTVARMRTGSIASFGAGADVAAASRPAVVERGGVRFGFVGFNAIGETPRAGPGTPGALSVRMPPRTGPLVETDLVRVLRAVRRTARQAEVVVVLPHWGTQYTHAPEPVQRRVARALVDAGADLVVGGHPHWVQGVDAVRGVPVLHSLGNFVFDMDFMEQTMQGTVLEAIFWGADLKAVRLLPYRMDPATFAPRPVRGEAAAAILADVWSTSTGPFAAP